MYEFTYNHLIPFLHGASGILWGPWTLGLILIVGFFLSMKTGWLAVTKVGTIWKHTFGSMGKKGDGNGAEGEVSSFQALATAMSACLGVGTIVGVATAIATGGPGAVFWMWFAGFLAIATKFSELTMAVHFREKNDKGEFVGGPMYYARNGLKGPIGKALAIIFSISVPIAAVGIGNMVQANSVAGALESGFGVPRIATGIFLVIVVAAVTLGGIKKIGAVAEKLIPAAAGLVILLALIGIALNITAVPAAFGAIFRGAFTFQSAIGGFAGAGIAAAMRLGIARGIFSNEGGLGSAPIAHATASVDHPVKQGMWGAIEVFIDTHVVCTLVALVVLTSGMWTELDAAGNAFTGAPLIIESFNTVLPGDWMGSAFITVGILLFGTTTMMGWGFYGEKGLEFLFGTKTNLPYRIFWLFPLVIGALGNIALVWAFSDVFNAFMLLPNLFVLLGLSGIIAKLTKDFFDNKPYVSYYEETQAAKK